MQQLHGGVATDGAHAFARAPVAAAAAVPAFRSAPLRPAADMPQARRSRTAAPPPEGAPSAPPSSAAYTPSLYTSSGSGSFFDASCASARGGKASGASLLPSASAVAAAASAAVGHPLHAAVPSGLHALLAVSIADHLTALAQQHAFDLAMMLPACETGGAKHHPQQHDAFFQSLDVHRQRAPKLAKALASTPYGLNTGAALCPTNAAAAPLLPPTAAANVAPLQRLSHVVHASSHGDAKQPPSSLEGGAAPIASASNGRVTHHTTKIGGGPNAAMVIPLPQQQQQQHSHIAPSSPALPMASSSSSSSSPDDGLAAVLAALDGPHRPLLLHLLHRMRRIDTCPDESRLAALTLLARFIAVAPSDLQCGPKGQGGILAGIITLSMKYSTHDVSIGSVLTECGLAADVHVRVADVVDAEMRILSLVKAGVRVPALWTYCTALLHVVALALPVGGIGPCSGLTGDGKGVHAVTAATAWLTQQQQQQQRETAENIIPAPSSPTSSNTAGAWSSPSWTRAVISH